MIRTGNESAKRITISNTEFDGVSSWSASCNSHHYWTMLMQGANDKVTFKVSISGQGQNLSNCNATYLSSIRATTSMIPPAVVPRSLAVTLCSMP